MNNSAQNKYEWLASLLHREKIDDEKELFDLQEIDLNEDVDFSAVKSIYEIKDLVSDVGKITPPEHIWTKVHSRIRKRPSLRSNVYWQYAAAIAIILTVGLFVGKNVRKYLTVSEQYVSIVSPEDEIKHLTLADGSSVWLNSGTTLKYSNLFGKSNRHVIVEGEALFKVVKDTKNPFTVAIGKSRVVVHGTVFNVKSYPADDKCEVVLVKGSVEFIYDLKNIYIKPGERVTVDRTSGSLSVDDVDTDEYTSWVSGDIYFENEPLVNLVNLFKKWYNVEFEFTNEKAKLYRFTGVINKKHTLDYTLKIIEMTNKVKFVKKGGKILITN